MVIDAHQHFWQYHPVKDAWITDDMKVIQQDFLPQHLLPVLAQNNVDGCVAVQADQSEVETDFLLGLAAGHDFIKGIVGWIDLRDADLENRLAHYSQFPMLKGFRHIVQGEPDPAFIIREDFCRGIHLLSKYNFTYDILVYPVQLPAVATFVQKFPDHRLVIDHLAKPYIKTGDVESWAQQMRAIAQYPHVYCKLSGMVTEADWSNWEPAHFTPFLEVCLEAFGADRLLFGSDWPVCQLAGSYTQVKGIVTDYISHLSATEQAKIMGGNAIAFYGL
ncbi:MULTISPECIES: amidohydrolase [unclassified Chitinophaga]|uniref:amidohydrolase family protein n=1 Tax=unclassified Chitinophaga TaxID=2619133 RepID=UPI0009CBDC87|nr:MULTISPECIES: amidohydrolase family protein [unclassified Chitinophaga]OMP80937.1 amidohydrolase [[Flexibacter] sp. ATCC 35208]WPV69916.1 amidohydrolase family protein [Chitinophaga sp. LS1]